MHTYYFNVRNGDELLTDREGTDFPNDSSACRHGRQVIFELMRQAEKENRHWLLEVCNSRGKVLFSLPFSAYDPTLDHLPPERRYSAERASQLRLELKEAVLSARTTILQSRAARARSKGKPYLVAQGGRRI